jgi:hypothetical protein
MKTNKVKENSKTLKREDRIKSKIEEIKSNLSKLIKNK